MGGDQPGARKHIKSDYSAKKKELIVWLEEEWEEEWEEALDAAEAVEGAAVSP